MNGRLKELRKLAGLTQGQVAEACNKTTGAYQKVEAGITDLDVKWMRSLAKLYKCSPADLLEAEDNPYRLDEREMRIIDLLRTADEPTKEQAHRVIEALCRPFHPTKHAA